MKRFDVWLNEWDNVSAVGRMFRFAVENMILCSPVFAGIVLFFGVFLLMGN